MDLLSEARNEIDAIDKEMAQLFCKRMKAVEKVVAHKKANGLQVFDYGREELVVEKNISQLSEENKKYAQWYEAFIRDTMAVSRAMQKRILAADTVAYQGTQGAFAQIAAKALYPHGRELSFATWAGVFNAVQNEEAQYGVLPFENSHAGDVSEVLDLCFAHPDIYVTKVLDLPVSQNLLCVKGAKISDIKTVVSHPQALSQSTRFLNNLSLNQQSFANTALAAQHVAQLNDKSVGAIASKQTASLFGLEILVENVNESEDNTTRFIVIEKKTPNFQQGKTTHFSLLFTAAHTAGSLARVMQTVADFGYNMECIKSRPMPHVSWEYYFYTEIEGVPSEDLLVALAENCHTVRVLGTYEHERATEE